MCSEKEGVKMDRTVLAAGARGGRGTRDPARVRWKLAHERMTEEVEGGSIFGSTYEKLFVVQAEKKTRKGTR